MPKKILLVDDEELFLKSLKQGLDMVADVFTTDICFSVNDAIKHIALKKYDMIITDIRMPEKSGIELLIYLRDIRFPGKVMVMTAYSTEESAEKIKSLGVVDVIAKPFKMEWFKDMLLTRFETGKAKTVTFESIDLITVLQIINLEKKTSVLQIETENKKGTIYFDDGEIIHAEYGKVTGEEALLKLVTLNNSIVSVIKGKEKVNPTVQIPFVKLVLKLTKVIDEMMLNQQQKEQKKESKGIGSQIKKVLMPLTQLKGYVGASVFTPQATHLEKSLKIKGYPMELISSLILDPLNETRKMTKEVGLGNLEMIQIHNEKGIILLASHMDEKPYFHTLVVLQPDGNVAMARIKLRKAVETLKSIL